MKVTLSRRIDLCKLWWPGHLLYMSSLHLPRRPVFSSADNRRSIHEANRWLGRVRRRMLLLVWTEWNLRIYLVGAKWYSDQVAENFGRYGEESWTVEFFLFLITLDCLKMVAWSVRLNFSVCWPRWCIFLWFQSGSCSLTSSYSFCYHWSSYHRPFTRSICCVATAV